MEKLIFIFLSIMLIQSCATVKLPKAPAWTSQNCTKDKNNYYFTSMGKGKELPEAYLDALKLAKMAAGLCLFGGSFTSKTSIKRSLNESNYSGIDEFKINEEHINWVAFEKDVLKEEIIEKDGTYFVFQRFKWPLIAIDQEKSRAQTLKKSIEEKRTLSLEVTVLRKLNNDKKAELSKLKAEEMRMKSYTDDIQRALVSIDKLKEVKSKESMSIRRLFSNLPCGITIREIINLYKEPDSYTYQEMVISPSILSIYWGEVIIKMSTRYIQKTTGTEVRPEWDKEKIYNYALDARPNFAFVSYGRTKKGYHICKED